MLTDSIAALADTLSSSQRLAVRPELKRAHEVLQPGETPELLAVGVLAGSGLSLIILTDRRVIALSQSGKSLRTHDLPFANITSVSSESGRSGSVTIQSAGSTMKLHPGERAGHIAERLRAQM